MNTMVSRLFLIFILIASHSFGQVNPELRNLLNLPTSECAENSPIFVEQMTSLDYSNYEGIGSLLDQWIEKCGYNEAVFRVYVLLTIQEGKLVESNLGEDLEYFIENFENRCIESRYSNYQNTFERNKDYYQNIPFRSTFDLWTKIWADSLSKHGNYQGLDHWFLSLYSNKKTRFSEKHLYDKEYDAIDFIQKRRKKEHLEKKKAGTFGILVGAWLPHGNLTDFMGPTAVIGLNGGTYLTDVWEVGGSLKFRVPNNIQKFRITTSDSTEHAKNTLGLILSADAYYDLWEYKRFRLRSIKSLGLEIFSTDIEAPLREDQEEPDVYSIFTYNIAAGLEFGYRNKRNSYIGMQLTYSLMNFNNGLRIVEDLSGNAVNLTLFYRF